MKLKRILLTFLLVLCLDLIVWRFVFGEELSAYRFFNAVTTGLMISLIWLIPIKTKKQLDELFLRESGLQLLENENVVLQSIANQIHGTEVVGGKLFLTDQRLVFISNRSHHLQMEFERTQIASVKPHPEFPKAIVLTTGTEEKHAFNVDLHHQWVNELAHVWTREVLMHPSRNIAVIAPPR